MQLNAILKPFPRELFTILPALSSPCEMMYLLFHIHDSFKKLQKIHIYFLFKEHTLHKQQKYPSQIKKAPSPFSEKGVYEEMVMSDMDSWQICKQTIVIFLSLP